MMGLLSSLALVVIVSNVAGFALPPEIEEAVVIPLATPTPIVAPATVQPATAAPTLRLTPAPSPEPTPPPLPETGMPTPQVPVPLPTPNLCVPLIELCL